ncbi:MAG: glutamate racemase [Paludibacter sp.]|jgi:glutamate racemase|nr:glutamate racemase [Paludibacter sp.]
MAAIGIFDSGYGGLTILDSIRQKLPQYDYVYLGDNARAPYGTRSFEVVYRYTLQCVRKLFEFDCPLIILACNTASAKALRSIQQNDLPKIAPQNRVLGVIRPTVEAVDKLTKTRSVGLLATSGTVQSNSYPLEIKKLYPDISITSQACPMWVPLVENNEFTNSGAEFFIEKDLKNLLAADTNIDAIMLGCTHYPLLLPLIEKFVSPKINIISQGKIVAESLNDYLQRHPEIDKRLSRNSTVQFYTSEQDTKFSQSASLFLNQDIVAQHIEM